MDIGKITYYARRVHRFVLLLVVILGLVQMITGLTLRYPLALPMIDQEQARLLHFQTALYFSVVFGLQMITGVIMYVAPWVVKRLNRPKNQILH